MSLTAALSAAPLRVAVVSEASHGKEAAAAISRSLAGDAGIASASLLRGDGSLAGLKEADAAIFVVGPGAGLSATNKVALRAFIDSGAGLVLIGAMPDAWPDDMRVTELIGAMPGTTPFAKGASLSVINLFAHPILTGITRLETTQPVSSYEKLAADAQMIIEGTAGEATTPLAWVRRRPGGRLCHIALAAANLFADPAYQRLVANAVLWSSARPIPGAVPAVQRTFMPEAHPGAFAITLPEGPGICLDPVRGGINYVWDGDFVDMRPRWLTKPGEPPRIFGEVFYRETQWQPLRAGSPGNAPDFQFEGYTLRDGYPEFHYRVGGREVHERFAALPGGGLVRTFRVAAGSAPLWLQLEPQAAADVAVRGVERDGNVVAYAAKGAGEFSIEIRPKKGGVR